MSKPGIKITILILLLIAEIHSAKIIWVENNLPVNSIKKAIGLCIDGDTIKIQKGFYNENDIVITKKIVLFGINFPVISGNDKKSIIRIRSNNVVIEGIEFIDAGVSFVKDNAAIKVDSSGGCIIRNNKFKNNFFGIYLGKSWNCLVENNFLFANHKKQTYSGNGIHLWYCRNIFVNNNIIDGHRDGVYLEFSKNCKIKANTSKNNLRYGLHFMFSDSCIYSYNNFEKNRAGVAVMFTHHVVMVKNIFMDNWGDASFGLLLKEITDGKISDNKFLKNSTGIYLEGSNRNTIEHNYFESNGWAVRLMANSMENVFSKNNFIGNSFEVTTNNIRNFNTFSGNYWSDYSGYDLNKDGIGDIPHHPVKLFSVLVENNRPLLSLLHGFFVELLNSAEKIFPVLTPETLVDNKPSMKIVL